MPISSYFIKNYFIFNVLSIYIPTKKPSRHFNAKAAFIMVK